MYAKIINNCILDVSKTEKDGYEYIAIDYDSFVKDKIKGLYKTCRCGVILKNGLPLRNNRHIITNNKTIIPKTESSTEDKLESLRKQFENNININIKYKNGFYYKPRYASESYQPLISAEIAIRQATQNSKTMFPMEIWDATKTHKTEMQFEQLVELALYLAAIYEKQFQEYKKQCAKIIEAKDGK